MDRIAVYLNGYQSAPACVLELADVHVLDPKNSGAERKFWWAEQHDGIYLSCDDDIRYPADYVATMCAELAEHPGIVSAHGRIYLGRPVDVNDVEGGSIGIFHKRVDYSRAINHGGTGVMAWDASATHVPSMWDHENISDMQIAIWAQLHGVPMWLVAHQAHWLESPTILDRGTIWNLSQVDAHRPRNKLLRQHGIEHGWRMHC